MKFIVFIYLLLQGMLLADVKSLDGNIKFDVQSDGSPEMTLNTTGLGINTTPASNLHVQGNAIISQKLFLGIQTGSANLNLSGSLGFSSQSVTTSSILENQSIYLADSSSDNLVLKLPYAGNVTGRLITIKKTSTSNKLWLVAQGGNLIDGERSLEFTSGSLPYASLVSNGSKWYTTSTSDSLTSVASDNLIGWWKLDEITSNTLINQTNSYPTYIFTKSAIANSDPSIGPGLFDQAIDLDGLGDNFYMLNSNGSLPYIDNATHLSISIWVKVNDLDSDGVIVSKGNIDILTAFLLRRIETGAVSGRTDTFSIVISDGGANNTRVEGANNLSTDNEWQHLAVTYESGSATGLRLYINGVEDANSPADTSSITNLASNGQYFRLGRADNTGEINGSLDEFRIFDRVLTPAEVQALYSIKP